MRRDADQFIWTEQLSGGVDGKRSLSEMHSIGINCKRNVEAIINQQASLIASCEVPHLRCELVQLPAFKIFLAQLDGSDATV